MTFPTKLRELIGERFIVTKGIDGCLFVYSLEDFEKRAEKIRSLPMAKARALHHRPHSGGHLSAGRGHGSVCCGRCILRTGISGLFPLQETPLLCHHSFNGCVDLGRIPLCAEC